MNPILKINNLNKHFDGVVALDDFSCEVGQGEILGLIGPNGAGKTTLFNVLTGFVDEDSGSAWLYDKPILNRPPHQINRLGISRTFQKLRLIRQMTVLENVMLSFQNQAGEHVCQSVFIQKKIREQEKENRDKAFALLRDADILKKVDKLAGELSYGQQKLLSLACSLASKPKVLCLDEPVAGINPALIEKISEMVSGLPEQGITVLLIEHNMDVVMSLCDRLIFMDIGEKISEGTPEQVRNDPKVIEAYLD